MATNIIQSSDGSHSSGKGLPSLVDSTEDAPAWFAARRERKTGATGAGQVLPTDSIRANTATAVPPMPPIPLAVDDTESQKKRPSAIESLSLHEGFHQWLSKQGLIGLATSLAIHAIILLILACFLVAQVKTREISSLWGTNGNPDEFAADIILDSELSGETLDSGEAAPLQMTDLSDAMNSLTNQGDIAESMRVGMGGQGTSGEGDSGDGTSMGVGNLKVPGHAQTKGSFSAWADPRDPKPGEDYFVVIQVRLPKAVTKYKGSDISGNVIGTDGYKQPIRLKSNAVLPVEEGAVRIRIPVPGARQLVRDTIRVESKLLKEKQTFEIEF